MKRKIELIIPLEYWAGESDWRLDHVGPDTVALTNAKGMRWILMIIGNRRPGLKWRWVILLLVWSIGMTIVAIVVMALAMALAMGVRL